MLKKIDEAEELVRNKENRVNILKIKRVSLFFLGFYLYIFFSLSAYDGVHRTIQWNLNWCWLDVCLHKMVEMDPIVTALTNLWSNNKLQSGLGLELFKVLRALQNPGEKHKLFDDILLSDNTINLKPLYDKIIDEKIIRTHGEFFSTSEAYQRLINWLLEKYPDVKEILMKVHVEVNPSPSNKPTTQKLFLNMKKFKKDIFIGTKNLFLFSYRDYFCITIGTPKDSNMPKIIDNLPLVENGGEADYEVVGFVLNASQYHFVAIVKSKNSQWYFYNGSFAEPVPEKKIESLLLTGSYLQTNSHNKFDVDSLVYKKMTEQQFNEMPPNKRLSVESMIKLLQTLKIKLQNLLQQVKVLLSSK
jgi:hypothetical protein